MRFQLAREGALEPRHWQLFVDETGNFADLHSRVAVCGLLIEEHGRSLPDAAVFTRAFRMAQPLAGYPLHATELVFPIAQLAGWLAHGQPVHAAGFSQPLFVRAAEILQACGQPLCKEFTAIFAGRVPQPPGATQRRKLLSAADNCLRTEAYTEWAGLHAFKLVCDERLRKFLEALRKSLGGAALVAVGASSDGGRLEGDAAPQPHGDRYLKLLSVLLERIVCLLRKDGASHRVVVRVATRYLDREPQTAPGNVSISQEHVEASAAAALAVPWVARQEAEVKFDVRPPARYDAEVHPGLVLADLVCNRAFHLIERSSWAELAEGVDHSLKMSIEMTCQAVGQQLPTFAAADAARAALLHALRGEPPHLTEMPKSWQREQAQRWIVAARRLPGTAR